MVCELVEKEMALEGGLPQCLPRVMEDAADRLVLQRALQPTGLAICYAFIKA
jgi:hypothetical protein